MPDHRYTRQNVLDIKQWVPNKLVSLTTTRNAAFTFEAGQFARLGLPASHASDAEPTIWRAYSMVNAPSQSPLEFYSIVMPEGEFSPRLASLRPGDPIYIDKTAYGFLTLGRFASGGNLWLLATGTGLSAYLSLLQDSNTWISFNRIILVHGVRHLNELAYKEQILSWVKHGHPCVQSQSQRAQLTYLTVPTQESLVGVPQARLTTLISNGELEKLAQCPLDPQTSKVMLCGNPDMLNDARKLLTEQGFAVGRRGLKGNLALENYW